jgi:DNA-directed RNA polymerase subunit RPC12/RpoP
MEENIQDVVEQEIVETIEEQEQQEEVTIICSKEEFNEVYRKIMAAYEDDNGADDESFMMIEGMAQLLDYLVGDSNELELPMSIKCPKCGSNEIDILEEDDKNFGEFKYECMDCTELFN